LACGAIGVLALTAVDRSPGRFEDSSSPELEKEKDFTTLRKSKSHIHREMESESKGSSPRLPDRLLQSFKQRNLSEINRPIGQCKAMGTCN